MCYITFFAFFDTLPRIPLLPYRRALYDHSIKKVIAEMQHILRPLIFIIYRDDFAIIYVKIIPLPKNST